MIREVVFLFLLNEVFCLSETVFRERPHQMPISVFGRPYGGFLSHRLLRKSSELINSPFANVKTEWITQKIDNFNASDSRKYKQRYMYNMEFYNNTGLAFIMIGGEAAISKYWIGAPNVPWLISAKKHGAACFQLEHRFYGASQPFNDVSTASYQYLTIEQALADLRNFILQMNRIYFSSFKKPRWVLFGGSYPGALAAWFRETNDDITIASISSSGVVQTRVDYYDYVKNVQYVLRTVDPNCEDAVRKGMRETIRLIYSIAGREKLKEVYNLCESFPEQPTPTDIQYFLANIVFLFEVITQYTDNNPRDLSVPNACKIMTNASEPSYMKRIQGVFNFYNSFYGGVSGCTSVNYTDYIEWLKNTTLDRAGNYERVSFRSWTWQCCSQVGFFQTTDNGMSIFGSSIPLDFYVDQCMELFGSEYNADRIREGVDSILRQYGGYSNYKGTRTVFANGSFDPWKSVCCENCNNTSSEISSVMVIDGSHCCDMIPANKYDSESLKNVRAFIEQKLDTFIVESLKDAADAMQKSVLLLLLSVTGHILLNFKNI